MSKRQALKRSDGLIEIRFDFDRDTLGLVKAIPGRRFHNDGPPPRSKYWTCPASPFALTRLKEAGFYLDPALLAKPVLVEPDLSGLKRELFPFQRAGVTFIEARDGKLVLGDEMGLGKTIQALAWLHLHPEKRPVVVVCPAHLKLNWVKEIRATLPGRQRVQVLSGTNPRPLSNADIVIINYDILPNEYERYVDSAGKKRMREIPRTGWVDFVIDCKPKVLIFDEAHYIKTSSTQRSKAVRKLAKRIPCRLALTGTPIINRPIEGFSILQVVDASIFPNFWDYAHRYCGAQHNGFGWDFSGTSNQNELHQQLQTVMLRRKKQDVLPELPDKLYSYVHMELTNADLYSAAEADFLQFLRKTKGVASAEKAKRAEYLVKVEALKQLAVSGKLKDAIAWIWDVVENGGGNGSGKLVVFAVHKATINALMAEFGDIAVKVDGSVPAEKRQAAVRAFQEDERIRLFIGNIQAAGTGLTLTAASSVAFVELPWTPGELAQAEDRCHRIGQKDTVNVYYLLTTGTIEERIAELLDAKRKDLSAILDGEEVEETKLLSELIRTYENVGEA